MMFKMRPLVLEFEKLYNGSRYPKLCLLSIKIYDTYLQLFEDGFTHDLILSGNEGILKEVCKIKFSAVLQKALLQQF